MSESQLDLKFTDREEAFLDALFDDGIDGDLELAAKKAGYNTVPKITDRLKDEIVARTNKIIATMAPKAAATVRRAITDQELVTPNALKASLELLDRSGLTKMERESKGGTVQALVVLPAKK